MVWAIAPAAKMAQPGSCPNIGPVTVSQHPKGIRPEGSVDLAKGRTEGHRPTIKREAKTPPILR